MNLTNKVALVTGGGVRVGRAISVGLAQRGARIGLHFNRSEEQALETKKEIEDIGSEVFLLQGDFSKISEIEKVVNSCHEHFHRIDILINNAAIYYASPFGETSEAQWDRLFDINLKAPFFCTQCAANYMKKQKSGKIISIADVAGIDPWSGFIPYSCTKAGIIAMTKGIAKALAPDIQVNAIASGTVLMQEDASAQDEQAIANLSLLKRIGAPADIVNTVVYLIEGSDFVTGEVVVVDGGRLLA